MIQNHTFRRDFDWLYLQIVRLLSCRYFMELFLTADPVWLLDHYKHDCCNAEHLKCLCRNQFFSIYVWNDVEFLWLTSHIGYVHSLIFGRISFAFVCSVLSCFHPLRNCCFHSSLLEQRPCYELRIVCFTGRCFGCGSSCSFNLLIEIPYFPISVTHG